METSGERYQKLGYLEIVPTLKSRLPLIFSKILSPVEALFLCVK